MISLPVKTQQGLNNIYVQFDIKSLSQVCTYHVKRTCGGMLLLTRCRALEDMAEVVVVTEDGNDPVVEDKQDDAMPVQRTLLNFAGEHDGGG